MANVGVALAAHPAKAAGGRTSKLPAVASQSAAPFSTQLKKASQQAVPEAAVPADVKPAKAKKTGAIVNRQTTPNGTKTSKKQSASQTKQTSQLPQKTDDQTLDDAEKQSGGNSKQNKKSDNQPADDAPQTQPVTAAQPVQAQAQANAGQSEESASQARPAAHHAAKAAEVPATANAKTTDDSSDLPQATTAETGETESAITAVAQIAEAATAAIAPAAAHAAPAVPATAAAPTPLQAQLAQAAQTPAVAFGTANNPQIVAGIHGQLLPDGGTMQIHLTPVELGEMQVSVHVRDGVVSASFQTTSDQATRLLTHNMSDLKSALEATGVSVGKIQVSQSPRSEGSRTNSNNSNSNEQSKTGADEQAQRQQQRRELLQRMWRKVSGGDPLDLVA